MSEQYAFPFVGKGPKGENIHYSGMTLRDWFAGQALAGIMAYPNNINGEATKYADVCSELSYQYADAMMKERQK